MIRRDDCECDQCGTKAAMVANGVVAGQIQYDLPAGWVTLQVPWGHSTNQYEFCSSAHATAWAAKRADTFPLYQTPDDSEDPVRSATFIVAASDAAANSIAQADRTCGGATDDVQAQAVIDAATALNGANVRLTEGKFTGGNLVMKSQVNLTGAGAGVNGIVMTEYYLANSTDDNIIDGSGSIVRRSIIRDIYFNGNKSNQASGYGIDATGWQYCKMQDCVFAYCKSHGLYIDGSVENTPNWNIFHSYFTQNDGDGYHMENEDGATWVAYCVADHNAGSGFYRKNNTECEFHHLNAGGNTQYGYYTESDVLLHDYSLHSEVCPYGGFYYKTCAYSQIGQLFSQEDAGTTYNAIEFYGGNDIDVCQVYVNSTKVASGYYGVKIDGPTIFMLTGGESRVTTAGAVALYYEATHSRVVNFAPVAPSGTKVTFAGGTNRLVVASPTWVNHNFGAATINDGGTIAHGLDATPTHANVTATIVGEIATVTTWDGTNITVAIKTNTGAAGTNQSIKWEARCE